jgi:hypothetical protein
MLKRQCYSAAASLFLALFSVNSLNALQYHGNSEPETVIYGNPDNETRGYPLSTTSNPPANSSDPRDSSGSVRCLFPKSVSAGLTAELSKFKQVKMPFNSTGLSSRERQMMRKLVQASQYLESIYWRQSDPEGLELYRNLSSCVDRQAKRVQRYLIINGSRYDLLEDNKPFADATSFPPGRAFYPEGTTKAEIEAYVAAHPEKKAEIYSPFTVVHKKGNDFVGVPYHEEYGLWLQLAAKALREAADLSADKEFAGFLRLRAEALLTDDYYKSDLAWVDLENKKFDVIFAPYETYLDDLLGVKTSYGAAVMVRNDAESQKLATYKQYVPDIQEALPLPAEDKPSKRGHSAPMEVMDTPYRSGDLRHGYQAVADNLPNDPRIHQEKGTKQIFFKNFMDARVNYVVLPLAKLLMREDQAKLASMDGYLATVLLHEISHGLGPAYARTSSGQKDIREAIGPAYSGLEEAKADIVGLFGLNLLMEKGILPKARASEYYASYVAGIFRTVRFGVAEAHGRAEMMEFNYLSEQGAIARDPQSGRYVIDYGKMPAAIAVLAKELLEIEATGDRNRAEKWLEKYGSMPSELKSALENIHNVPVDIDPVSDFKEKIQ